MQLSGIEKLKLAKELNGIRGTIQTVDNGLEKLKMVKRIGEIRVLLGGKKAETSGTDKKVKLAQYSSDKRKNSTYIQGIGHVTGTVAGDLKVGDSMIWNGGSITKVHAIAKETAGFIWINEIDENGKVWEGRKLKKDRIVARPFDEIKSGEETSKIVELPQGPGANELDLSEDDIYAREDYVAASSIAFNKFRAENQFQTQDDEEEWSADNESLIEFESTAFLVEKAVKEYGGTVVWGNFDASAYVGSVFDSAGYNPKVEFSDEESAVNGDKKVADIAWTGSPGKVAILAPTPKDIGKYGAGTFRIGKGELSDKYELVKVDPSGMKVSFLDEDEWDDPVKLKKLTVCSKDLFESAYRGKVFDSVMLDGDIQESLSQGPMSWLGFKMANEDMVRQQASQVLPSNGQISGDVYIAISNGEEDEEMLVAGVIVGIKFTAMKVFYTVAVAVSPQPKDGMNVYVVIPDIDSIAVRPRNSSEQNTLDSVSHETLLQIKDRIILDSAALDSVVSPGSIVGQIADKKGNVVARARIEQNGVLTVFKGGQGLEQVASPTAAVAKINAAIDAVFGGVENKVSIPLPHDQGSTVEQEKERLRQALTDAYRQERDATKALIESIDDSSVVDKKTAEQVVGDIRRNNQAIRFVEDALIEIENAGFNSDDSYFAIASETPEALELTQLKDQIDTIINGLFQKGDDAQAAKSAPAATESQELTNARAKLQKLMDLQQRMKDANKVIKSKKLDDAQKIVQLAEQGYSEAQAIELMKPDFAGRIGFADYQLTNNNATIRNTQKRIAELEARETAQQRAASGNSQTSYEFEGGNIELNYGDDRLQVFFDRKPDSEAISKLKSNGFKWSPTNVAWQRQLTDNAISTANYLFGTSIPTAASMVNKSESKSSNEPVPVPSDSDVADPSASGEAGQNADAGEANGQQAESQENPMKSAFIAELEALKAETDINAFNDKLDDIAGRIEAAGLMEELDAELNAAADVLSDLLAEAEAA
jgi:hypothetical protein